MSIPKLPARFAAFTVGLAALAITTTVALSQDAMRKITRAPEAEINKHIDRDWFKKSMYNLLDPWLEHSIAPNGFIMENLDRQWKPYGTQREATINGQGRQLYTLVVGYEYSKDKRYLDAITKSADFLLKMHDDQYGGYYDRVAPDLKVIDDSKTAFSSFAIFPMAHAARVLHSERYAKAAMDAWHEVKTKMLHGGGRMNYNRDFSGPGRSPAGRGGTGPGGPGAAGRAPQAPPQATAAPLQERPLDVHMYEAIMALYEATGSQEILGDLKHQWDLIDKTYNYEVGYLPEGFGGGTGNFNVGHLFEWSWLLSRSVELGAPVKFIELGNRELDLGLKVGYNKPEGGIWMNADINGNLPRRYMIWWNQAELLRATAHYATLHGRTDLWPYFDQSLAFLKKNFIDPEYGGWFEGVIPGSPREALGDRAYIKGAVDGPEFGAYHQTSMYHDLLRIADPKFRYPAVIKYSAQ